MKLTKKSAHWYIDYKGADGVRKRVKGFRDKTATTQLAAKLEKEAELAEVGIVDRYKEHRNRPLTGHLKDFKAALLAKGGTKKHAGVVFTRASAVMDGCGFSFIVLYSMFWGLVLWAPVELLIFGVKKGIARFRRADASERAGPACMGGLRRGGKAKDPKDLKDAKDGDERDKKYRCR